MTQIGFEYNNNIIRQLPQNIMFFPHAFLTLQSPYASVPSPIVTSAIPHPDYISDDTIEATEIKRKVCYSSGRLLLLLVTKAIKTQVNPAGVNTHQQ